MLELTRETGVDVAVEAVGTPATFDICQSILAPGGHLANVGVHGKPVELHLEKLWIEHHADQRLVDTVTTPMLLKVVRSGQLQPSKLVTHRFALDEVMKAYEHVRERRERTRTQSDSEEPTSQPESWHEIFTELRGGSDRF